jgi:hypothetical protein
MVFDCLVDSGANNIWVSMQCNFFGNINHSTYVENKHRCISSQNTTHINNISMIATDANQLLTRWKVVMQSIIQDWQKIQNHKTQKLIVL